MSAPSMSISLARQIRKLRKKLRQIENLERLGRQLSEEERLKIGKKSQFRERLQEYLAQVSDDEDAGKLDSFNSPARNHHLARMIGQLSQRLRLKCPEKENPPKKQEPPAVKQTSEKTALKKKKWVGCAGALWYGVLGPCGGCAGALWLGVLGPCGVCWGWGPCGWVCWGPVVGCAGALWCVLVPAGDGCVLVPCVVCWCPVVWCAGALCCGVLVPHVWCAGALCVVCWCPCVALCWVPLGPCGCAGALWCAGALCVVCWGPVCGVLGPLGPCGGACCPGCWGPVVWWLVLVVSWGPCVRYAGALRCGVLGPCGGMLVPCSEVCLGLCGRNGRVRFVSSREYPDHSDIVNDLVVDGRILVTASRDTTLKVWDLEEGRQLRNLGGHTGSVTTVFLLSEQASQKSGYLAGKPPHHRLVISGSTDCSFKIWNIATGAILKSVYTYNPITRLVCNQKGLIVTGTDGGKMEIWDMETGENLHSVIACEGAVTAMKFADNQIYSTSSTGVLKVFQIRDNCLACMYEGEPAICVGSLVTPRFIRSLAVFKHMIFYGDDAINIKLLEWKRGIVKKLPNHTDEFASTDAICSFEDLLIASSYDLDNGLGYINIRSLPHGDYLATLDDEDTERIVCLGCGRTKSGNLVLVTGGMQLKVWEIDAVHSPSQEEEEEEEENYVHFISRLNRPGRDSDVESDSDLSDSDLDPGMDDDENGGASDDLSFKKEEEKSSWLSYCAIL
ncbi:LOW QUALITY PROTEIN: uncharacterized protein LOC124271321 [Haliotis rubra]|uniref:LOW QUALITY PROTEIN: uncharacterized protein LOC124271321 n=1 Tax=Haliotis rubra TaxID=36100 RepID=UPI001EE5084F|nr:LOW QUALITY PROTEIN: uncharacterized protein LOC124271321 [Haliotis rubra]